MVPLVTVIIPTHNRPAQLCEAVDSVIAQQGRGTLFELEIIVVDDASSDETASAVASYPVTYLRHSQNRGLAAARNTGIQAGRGQYVAFLDDDDLWLPTRLQTQVPILESDPSIALVYSSCITIVDDRQTRSVDNVGPSGLVFGALLEGNFVGYLTVLVRRAALDQVGGSFRSDVPGLEDYDLWLRLAQRFPFRFVAGPVAVYRLSSRGMFVRSIASGASRELHRRVVNRALEAASIPPGRQREKVIDRMELSSFFAIRDLLVGNERHSQMVAHLREYPRLARSANVRDVFAEIVWDAALATELPVHTATTMCDSLERSPVRTRHTRQLLGRVWAEVAVGSLGAGRGGVALQAARRALRCDAPELVARLLPSPRRWLRAHPGARSRIRRLLKTLTQRT
jgi:glycosyltransferase involved in cell wall biosynthesis